MLTAQGGIAQRTKSTMSKHKGHEGTIWGSDLRKSVLYCVSVIKELECRVGPLLVAHL